jgi:hypothetical protein
VDLSRKAQADAVPTLPEDDQKMPIETRISTIESKEKESQLKEFNFQQKGKRTSGGQSKSAKKKNSHDPKTAEEDGEIALEESDVEEDILKNTE